MAAVEEEGESEKRLRDTPRLQELAGIFQTRLATNAEVEQAVDFFLLPFYRLDMPTEDYALGKWLAKAAASEGTWSVQPLWWENVQLSNYRKLAQAYKARVTQMDKLNINNLIYDWQLMLPEDADPHEPSPGQWRIRMAQQVLDNKRSAAHMSMKEIEKAVKPPEEVKQFQLIHTQESTSAKARREFLEQELLYRRKQKHRLWQMRRTERFHWSPRGAAVYAYGPLPPA